MCGRMNESNLPCNRDGFADGVDSDREERWVAEAEEEGGDDWRRLEIVVRERAVLEPRVDALERRLLDAHVRPGALERLCEEPKHAGHSIREVHVERVALRPPDTHILRRGLLGHLRERLQRVPRGACFAEGRYRVCSGIGPRAGASHVQCQRSDARTKHHGSLPQATGVAGIAADGFVDVEDCTEDHLAKLGWRAAGKLCVVVAELLMDNVDEKKEGLSAQRADVALEDLSAHLPRTFTLFPHLDLSL